MTQDIGCVSLMKRSYEFCSVTARETNKSRRRGETVRHRYMRAD